MSDNHKVLVRNAREQDIPAIAEIAVQAFTAGRPAEKQETLQRRLTAFPNGFVILVAENEIAGYGCAEKWLSEHEPGMDDDPMVTHQPDGRLFWIRSIAVSRKFQGRGYRLLLLDKLIETAHLEGCKRLVLETADAQELYRQRDFTTIRNRTERGISLDVMSLDLKSISRTP